MYSALAQRLRFRGEMAQAGVRAPPELTISVSAPRPSVPNTKPYSDGSSAASISVAAAPSPKIVRSDRSPRSMNFVYVSAVISSTRLAMPAANQPVGHRQAVNIARTAKVEVIARRSTSADSADLAPGRPSSAADSRASACRTAESRSIRRSIAILAEQLFGRGHAQVRRALVRRCDMPRANARLARRSSPSPNWETPAARRSLVSTFSGR